MVNRNVFRGDDHALLRPLWVLTLVNDVGAPFDLAGCTVWATYKPAIVPIEDDPDDETAAIQHVLIVGADGVATTEDGLYLTGPGEITERLTSAESAAMPPNEDLVTDVQLMDANGEIMTFPFVDTLAAVDSVTNRTEVAP